MKKEVKKIFNLPEDLIVESVRSGEKGTIIECRVKKKAERCLHCKGKVGGYDHVKNKKPHTVVDGKKVILEITKRRFQCRTCGKVMTEKIDGASGRFTDHFIQLIQEKARYSDYTSVAREVGVCCSTVGNKVDLLDTDRVNLPQKKS